MPSPEATPGGLTPALRATLLRVARDSIAHGLREGRPLAVEPLAYPEPLRTRRAVFVTLRRAGALRGCVGELEASRPLVEAVAENAFAAAFRDPRFPPLAPDEEDDLELHLSVLGPLEPLPVTTETELLAALEPGCDGLVVADGARRATFLPAVWESLPEPRAFLDALLRKAAIPGWSAATRAWRYRVEEFPA